jgi:hypothetical protein
MLAALFMMSMQALGAAVPGSSDSPVGFTQRWVIDSTRRLPDGERYGLRYRPVLVNIWYPATATTRPRIPVAGYIDNLTMVPGAKAVGGYARALQAYQYGVVWAELAGRERDSVAAPLRRAVDQYLASPSGAVRDAPWRPGAAPVVVYAQGSGSSLDDNITLCEALARRGYIVVGGAFPAEDNTRFGTNATDESRQRDLRRALMELTRMTGRDPGRVVAIGHSAGAQALLLMATDPSAPIDAVLSLDTTQDYAGLSDRSWSYFTDRVVADRRYITRPIVFVASPGALFELADSLREIPRRLVTVRGLDHNDFITQGIVRRRLRTGLTSDNAIRRDSAEAGHAALTRYVEAWLDAFHGRPGAVGALRAATSGPFLHEVVVDSGVTGPISIEGPARGARDLRHRFWTLTPEGFADQALALRSLDPEEATDIALSMILVDAVRKGQPEKAQRCYAALLARDKAMAGILTALENRAKMFRSMGRPWVADEWQALVTVLAEPSGK